MRFLLFFGTLVASWCLSSLAKEQPLKDFKGYSYTPNRPKSFDCEWRKAAYAYGKNLLPRLGSFDALYEALGLNVECNGEKEKQKSQKQFSFTSPRNVNMARKLHDELHGAIPDDAIYVSPANTDSNSTVGKGTFSSPLNCIQTAADRAVDTSSKLVVLRAGVYYIAKTLKFGPQHSGIHIMAYKDEEPVISGGLKLNIKWEEYDVSEVTGKNIYVANLNGQSKEIGNEIQGLQLDGVRATRARYPNLKGGIEVSPMMGSMNGGSTAEYIPPDFNRFGKPTYYTDNTLEHRRNDTITWKVGVGGWFDRYAIGIGGLCSVYEPPVGYWCSNRTAGGGAFPFRTPSGIKPKTNSLPNMPYKYPEDAVFFVWHPGRWANWMFKVKEYNPSTGFKFGFGGFQGARGSNHGGDWFVENLFEELDSPGEFFYDVRTKNLYFFHNGTGSPDPDTVIVTPKKQVLVNITGTQWNPTKNIKLTGVKLAQASYTYMNPHGVPSAGDWALERTGAVFLQGTEGFTMSGCTMERVDGNGVMISGYNRNVTIRKSDFSYIGGTAIASWGYTNETEGDNHPQAGIDGTDGNHPRYTLIEGCSIREVGLYEKQASFYMQAKTAQSEIRGNVFFNGPRAGINYNDGFGGGDTISHNLVFSTCRESGDHGPFNSWDRQPYLTDIRTGKPSMRMAWREIHHNFFVDNYNMQEGVDNDDGSGYYKTHHNFFVYGNTGMKNDFGGHDNWHYENIYAYVNHPLGVGTGQLKGHEARFFNNKVVMFDSEVGHLTCADKGEQAKSILYGNEYYTNGKDLTECKKNFSDWQAMGNEKDDWRM